ncbi:MAG: heavy metal-binding domain-containing protein [Nitrospinae bacterium]|nr:heavy metal-binding domain-containing protein [Nitrospinota bacterium]
MEIYFTIFLIVLGYFAGKRAEAKHYRSIIRREEQFRHLPTINLKRPIAQEGKVVNMELVSGCVVISIDYFKRLLAGLRNIFGGNISSYETLVDRARREAILRMKEQCPDASQIINLRIETSSIFKTSQKGSIGSVEVIAYGTAVTIR